MDFKNMSDVELAEFIVELITKVSILKQQLNDYLEDNNRTTSLENNIKSSYRQLKTDFQEYYHYLSLVKNESGSILYESYFYYSIRDAYVKGFYSPKNSKINIRMLNSVSEALEELNYLLPIESWNKIANKDSDVIL